MSTKANKRNVLIVDDDSDMQIFLSTLMKSGDFKPIIAGNGVEGFEKAKRDPACIILDVPMPDNTGIQMYHHLKQDKKLKKIPVIMISTLEQKTLLQYLRSFKFFNSLDITKPDAYLKKPLEAEEFLVMVQKIITESNKEENRM